MKREPSRLFSKTKFRVPLCAWLAYLLLLSLVLAGASLARYVSVHNAADTARVAAWNVDVTYDEGDTEIALERPPDRDEAAMDSFYFTVSNADSEVACQYDIILTIKKADRSTTPISELLAGVMIMLSDGKSFEVGVEIPSTNDEIRYKFSDIGTGILPAGESDQFMLMFTGNFDTITDNGNYDMTISVQAEQID